MGHSLKDSVYWRQSHPPCSEKQVQVPRPPQVTDDPTSKLHKENPTILPTTFLQISKENTGPGVRGDGGNYAG